MSKTTTENCHNCYGRWPWEAVGCRGRAVEHAQQRVGNQHHTAWLGWHKKRITNDKSNSKPQDSRYELSHMNRGTEDEIFTINPSSIYQNQNILCYDYMSLCILTRDVCFLSSWRIHIYSAYVRYLYFIILLHWRYPEQSAGALQQFLQWRWIMDRVMKELNAFYRALLTATIDSSSFESSPPSPPLGRYICWVEHNNDSTSNMYLSARRPHCDIFCGNWISIVG